MLVVFFRGSDWRSGISRGFSWARAKCLKCLVFGGNPGADLDPRLHIIQIRSQTVKTSTCFMYTANNK